MGVEVDAEAQRNFSKSGGSTSTSVEDSETGLNSSKYTGDRVPKEDKETELLDVAVVLVERGRQQGRRHGMIITGSVFVDRTGDNHSSC